VANDSDQNYYRNSELTCMYAIAAHLANSTAFFVLIFQIYNVHNMNFNFQTQTQSMML